MIVQKPEAERRLDKKLDGRKADWFLLSSAGTRKLGGPYSLRSQAVARERQVQYWKRHSNPEKLVGGLGDRLPDSAFDKKQLKAGIAVELEHTRDRGLAKEIAKDHLVEDPEYYEKLTAIEGKPGKYRLEKNPALQKVAEMHPDDRAIVGSAIGSAAGYVISPAVAPLGAAAGHIAGKRLGRPRRNPSPQRQRSLRNIALDIKRSWRDPWHAGPESRRLVLIRNIVDALQTLCSEDDVVETGPFRGKTGKAMVGNFLANVGGVWRGADASRIRDELREISKKSLSKNPKKKSKKKSSKTSKKTRKRISKIEKKLERQEKSMKGAAVGSAVGGVAGSLLGPAGAAVGAGAGGYAGAKVGAKKSENPFSSRKHNWKEVLIQTGSKRITRQQIRDYYWKNRKKIWPFLEGQTVLVVMAPSKNDFVLLRKRPSDEKYIKLTKLDGIDDDRSFEYWVNRRVIEFHPVLTGKRTPILWLDIDIHGRTNAQKATLKATARKAFPKLRKIMRQFGVTRIYAYDSGIGGYHLEGPLKAPKGVDRLRKDFTAALKEAFEGDSAFTTGLAKTGQIRLDTTTLHTLGSLRAPYSYTVVGGTKKRI